MKYKPECRDEYEVDSMVAVTTKPMVHKLKEIFEIPIDIGIIIPR